MKSFFYFLFFVVVLFCFVLFVLLVCWLGPFPGFCQLHPGLCSSVLSLYILVLLRVLP